jgi:hypothetical protein
VRENLGDTIKTSTCFTMVYEPASTCSVAFAKVFYSDLWTREELTDNRND